MTSSAPSKFRLIFHIGAGKTGTSSVQASLREGAEQLRQQGYVYWGLMLERAPVKKYDWQKVSARKEFSSLSTEVAAEQVFDVLSHSIQHAASQGMTGAIWSHEWFFNKSAHVIPALKLLEAEGVKIEVAAYVRRHDAWARSAYMQWGIKHKTYKGRIKSFSEYVKERPVRFYGALEPWAREFPKGFLLRNFDATDDVVGDFLAAFNLPSDIKSVRVNETPDAEELLLRAVYNNLFPREVLPADFESRFLRDRELFLGGAQDWLGALCPDETDLRDVVADASQDIGHINTLLKKLGQPPIEINDVDVKTPRPDQEKLVFLLAQIVVRQEIKLQRMQKNIAKLSQESDP